MQVDISKHEGPSRKKKKKAPRAAPVNLQLGDSDLQLDKRYQYVFVHSNNILMSRLEGHLGFCSFHLGTPKSIGSYPGPK